MKISYTKIPPEEVDGLEKFIRFNYAGHTWTGHLDDTRPISADDDAGAVFDPGIVLDVDEDSQTFEIEDDDDEFECAICGEPILGADIDDRHDIHREGCPGTECDCDMPVHAECCPDCEDVTGAPQRKPDMEHLADMMDRLGEA